MKNKYLFGILSLIVLLATVCRTVEITKVPPSLNWDEVSVGYNANSILKTSKDEYGNRFPLTIRSLDDYKQPVYTYLVVGSIILFGYNDFAVRFPSIFAGILTTVIVFFLVRELLFVGSNKDEGKKVKFQYVIPLLSALLIAIQPWNIQFSRMAAEANVGLFFSLSFMYFFLKGLNKPKLMVISALFFILSIYSYLSSHVFTPLLFLYLLYVSRNTVWTKRKLFIKPLILFLAAFFLLAYEVFFQGTNIRFKGTNIFSQTDQYKTDEKEMFYDASLSIDIPRRLFHDNHILTSVQLVARGYLSHFSPDFLFFDTGYKHHHAPRVGLIYFWLAPFIFIGLLTSFKKFRLATQHMLVFIFLSLVPPSVTWDVPHAIRSIGMSIPLAYFAAYGIYTLGQLFFLKKKVLGITFSFCILIVFVFSTFYYLHQYIIHLPYERSQSWVYGRKEMTEYLFRVHKKYDKVIVSTKLEWPYIFMLYYGKYDPVKYLLSGGTVSGGWGEENNHFENFYFHKFDRSYIDRELTNGSNNIYVFTPGEVDYTGLQNFSIRNLDGSDAVMIASENLD